MKYDDLEKLNALREKGAITEEEYQREKEKILNRSPLFNHRDLLGMDQNTYCVLLHLSQFMGYIFPLVGFAAPVVLWMMNREKYPVVDAHGKVVLNWLISSLIYYGVFAVLAVILIGIPFIVALSILSLVFIIMGAVKANNGEVWRYPLSIEFIKV